MENHDHLFTPEQVDEQIEQQRISGSQATPEARFLAEMQQVAWQIREEHERSLLRVEDRLMKYSLTRAERPTANPPEWQPRPSSPLAMQQGSFTRMENRSSKSRQSGLGRRLSLLVAVLIMVVLVGSLVLVQKNLHQSPAAPVATATTIPSPTPTPEPLSEGTTVYTTFAGTQTLGFRELAWSPDSRRIVSLDDANGLQIWDATTGAHKVTIRMTGAQDVPLDVSWSPDGRQLAIATGPHILIASSQTGAILKTYTAPTASAHTSAGSSYLSAMLPASGDTLGFTSASWSPDGRFIATSLTVAPPASEVEVLNAQSGVLAFTLPTEGYNVWTLSWSSDSQYLAANAASSTGNSQVWAWNVSTRQVVARHVEKNGGSDGSPAWQPASHNLAFVEYILKPGGGFETALGIWNPFAGQEIHHFPTSGFANGGLAWSPDGKRLAYVASSQGPKNTVNIISANSGQQLYSYKGHQNLVALVAWSPDDQYIVSAEGNTFVKQGRLEARVWVA